MTIQRPFSSGSRSAPDPYDNYLEQHGYYRKHTARDSSSLFRVVSEQIYGTQNHHLAIREQCIKYMRKHRGWFQERVEEDFDDYLNEMSKPKSNGSLLELEAIAYMHQGNVLLFHPMELGFFWIFQNSENVLTFQIFVSPDLHFDTVYAATYIEEAAYCQSICYEILYKNVFKLPDVTYAVEQMLYGASFDHVNIEEEKHGLYCRRIYLNDGREFEFDMPELTNCILENQNLCHFHNPSFLKFVETVQNSEDQAVFNKNEKSDTTPRKISDSFLPDKYKSCVRQLLDEGITPFPYKVAKALDPDMYRNIEFDSWSEIRKEHRFQNWYAGGTNLQVGVKCQVYLHKTNEYLTGYIQEINGNDSNSAITDENCNGPCVVFIEQFGEKRIVPYDCLKPLPPDQIKPWPLPFRLQQKYSNGLVKSYKKNQNFDGSLNCKMIEYNGYDNFTPTNQNFDVMPLTIDITKKKEKTQDDCAQHFAELNLVENDPYIETTHNVEQSSITPYDQCASYGFPDTFGYNYSYNENNVIHTSIPGQYYNYYNGYHQPIYMQPPSGYYQASAPIANAASNTRMLTGIINYSSRKSILENGDDLPVDVSTLRFFYNMGVEHYNEMKSKEVYEKNVVPENSYNKIISELEEIKLENDSTQNGTNQIKVRNGNNQKNYNGPPQHQQQNQIKFRYNSRYFNNRKGQNNYRGGNNNSGGYSRYPNNNSKNYLKVDNRNNRSNQNNDVQRVLATPNSISTDSDNVQTSHTYGSDSQTNSSYSQYSYEEQHIDPTPSTHSNALPNGKLYLPPQMVQIPITTLGPPPPLPANIPSHPSNGFQYITTPLPAPNTPGIAPHFASQTGIPNQYYVPSAPSGNEILGLVPDGLNGHTVSVDHGQYPLVNCPVYYFPNNQSNGQPATPGQQGYWYTTAPPLLPSQSATSQCMTPNSNKK